MTDEISLVQIGVTGKDIGGYRLGCDKLATTPEGTLLLAQVVAPAVTVKGLAGVLHNNGQIARIELAEGKLSSEDYPSGRYLCNLARADGGYERRGVVHLGYGIAHALFVARMPGLLFELTEEALWHELSGPRFTTPLLRGWVPWLRSRLRDAELLVPCLAHGCKPGILKATTADLDTLVEKGIKQGTLRLEEAA